MLNLSFATQAKGHPGYWVGHGLLKYVTSRLHQKMCSLRVQTVYRGRKHNHGSNRNRNRRYTVQFRNNRVVYADREWYLTKGDLDAFESTIAALGSLADNEKSPLCNVSQVPVHTPDGSSNNVFISCGQRTITLSRIHLNSVGETGYSVREQIGEMLPDH
jgi:hypothetical protein